jgi:hypothetical protein
MTSCIHTGTCVYKHKKCSHCFFTYIFVRKNYSDSHLSTFTCINVLSSGATSGAGTAYPSGTPGSPPAFSVVRVTRSLVLFVCFVDRCLSFWPLCCLFFELRILITPLVPSNFSWKERWWHWHELVTVLFYDFVSISLV